jgi:hypothetical protein
MAILQVAACDVPYARIMPVPFQQFITKTEKTIGRHTIILQYDTFLFLAEKPGNGGTHAFAAAQVIFLKKRFYLAFPVYMSNYFSCLFAQKHLARFIGARAVGGNVQARRFSQPYVVKNL